jgi:hypothetical protein
MGEALRERKLAGWTFPVRRCRRDGSKSGGFSVSVDNLYNGVS